jgi:adenylate cyclase
MDPDPEPPRLTLWQRMAVREVRKQAGKAGGEPLSEEDWGAVWALHARRGNGLMHRFWAALPASPRCSMCAAPFAGAGRLVTRPLGYRPSRKNPNLCVTCVEASPPGGMTLRTGVLFADLRGFTASSEGQSPQEVSKVLRRFYGHAEDVLFPEAIIDKLIGDEVMALSLPHIRAGLGIEEIPVLMVEHARELLRAIGYGSSGGPFVELGIGLDFGEAFVGNIGDGALFDFTAVGDVVNTASRLQGEAAGGEIVLSSRIASALSTPPGDPVSLRLKGKSEPVTAYRLRETTSGRS